MKKKCDKGHSLTKDNTYVTVYKRCKICMKEESKKYYERKRK